MLCTSQQDRWQVRMGGWGKVTGAICSGVKCYEGHRLSWPFVWRWMSLNCWTAVDTLDVIMIQERNSNKHVTDVTLLLCKFILYNCSVLYIQAVKSNKKWINYTITGPDPEFWKRGGTFWINYLRMILLEILNALLQFTVILMHARIWKCMPQNFFAI